MYDIIITGGGMAGLSLAYYLNHSTLRNKKILIIDREPKRSNDRTWGFWQVGDSPFDSVLHRCWDSVWFHGTRGFSRKMELNNHRYKLLRGRDFYAFIANDLAQNPQISFLYTELLSIESKDTEAVVTTAEGVFKAHWCFDSTYQPEVIRNLSSDTPAAKPNPRTQDLLQHFKGWVVRTPTPTFDADVPVMMDFRIDQQGECRFVYVMPTSSTEALVEFTLFTPTLLSPEAYDEGLKNYLHDFLKIDSYEIIEEEFGIIPMTDESFREQLSPRVIRIGTAGGYTRASTGYTFTRTQKRLQQLVGQLEQNFRQSPVSGSAIPLRYRFYDQVMLNVFLQNRCEPADIFSDLFRKNPAERIFRFLDEETTIPEEVSVLYSVPILPFTIGALDVFRRNIREIFHS